MSSPGPRWLQREVVLAVHGRLLVEHGGAEGLRDAGLLDSALARPQHHFTYHPQATVFELAAAYAFGLARNHAFVDGNKRIALAAAALFLRLNGHRLVADEAEAVVTIVDLAAGHLTEPALTRWLEAGSRPC